MIKERSPYGLIQEDLCDRPWRMLIACIMLNLTNIKQVRPIIWKFFEEYPDEVAAARADKETLATMLQPLGLHNRRAGSIIKFSTAYATGGWTDVLKLPGIGKYAADSYEIFVVGNLDVRPTDSKLKLYLKWALGRPHATGNEMCQAA